MAIYSRAKRIFWIWEKLLLLTLNYLLKCLLPSNLFYTWNVNLICNNLYWNFNIWYWILICVDCVLASMRITQVDPGWWTPSPRWCYHSNLLWVVNNIGWILLLSRKNAPDATSQPGWVAHGTRLSFSLTTTIEAVGFRQASIDGLLLGLSGPYTSMRLVCSILDHGGQPIGP
jgi:hypothetical protein